MSSSHKLVSKVEREKCWSARDKFWDCVVKLSHDSPDIDTKVLFAQCPKERSLYESACPKTWVRLRHGP